MKNANSEKGFTLVEILIVMSIISILFVILIPQVNSYFVKTSETGLRIDFREFQQSSEAYLRETVGKNIQVNVLNNYLDSSHKVNDNGSSKQTKSVDPWGNFYEVDFGEKRISFASYGKEKNASIKKYELFSYYHNGAVDSCTKGFDTGNIKLSKLNNLSEGFECGEELPTVLVPPLPPPDPPITPLTPSNFKAINITSSSITLSWNAVSEATSYELKRNGIIIYPGNGTTYTNTSLIEYTPYSYSLIAKNSSGVSGTISLVSTTLPTENTIKLPEQGTGTCSPYDPYIITTVGELQGIKLDLDGCFILGNDINASSTSSWNGGKGFEPIQNSSFYFTGQLDGKNHSIDNLFINRPTEDWVALFNAIETDGLVKNIVINNGNVTGNNYVSLLSSYNDDGIISNSQVSGTVTGSRHVGGFIALNEGILNTVISEVNAIGNDSVGGIVSDNFGFIENALLKEISSVTGTEIIGGIIGYQGIYANASNLTVEGAIIKGYEEIGGIIGSNSGALMNGYSKAIVEATNDAVGGVIGHNEGSVSDVISEANVIGIDRIGGVIGQNYGAVNNVLLKATATIIGNEEIGGILGFHAPGINMSNATVETATITGSFAVGGVIGLNNGSLFHSYSKAKVQGEDNVGGLVGRNENGTITHTYSMGIVTGVDNIGGLIGRHKTSTLTSSYYDKTISGQSDTGKGDEKTTAQMKTQTTYIGWDFTNVWQIDPIINNGYPTLRNMPQ